MKVTSDQATAIELGASSPGKDSVAVVKSFNSLAPGDKFKATVTDIQPNQVTLKLSGGDSLTAKSLVLPDARIGEDSIFLVKENFKGQILLEMLKPDQNSYQSGLIKEALLNAELHPVDENMDLARLLMKNNLPIDAETLGRAAFFKYSDPQLSVDKLLFLLKENLPTSEKSITVLNGIMDNTLKIKDTLESITSEIFKIPEDGVKKAIAEIILGLNKPPGEGEASIQNRQRLAALIDSVFGENARLRPEGKELEEQLRELTKEINRKFFIDLKSETPSQEMKKFYGNLEETVSKISEYIKTLPDNQQLQSMSSRLAEVKDSIWFMDKINNYKEYVQIPFSVNGERNQGDIFIFRNSPGSKNYNEQASVLIALDNASIGRVEVFVTKHFTKLSLNFRAEHEPTVKLINKNINTLVQGLAQKGYSVNDYKAVRLTAKSQLTDIPQAPGAEQKQQSQPKRYSFDMRV